MSGNETESRRAAHEARRDVLGHAGATGTANRHDALLRYLRGLYVRPSKEHKAPETPKTDPAENGENAESENADGGETTEGAETEK